MFKAYLSDNSNPINFRVYGKGPAIVLFHPSPNSCKLMHPLAALLAEDHTVICPDTPGYGHSRKLDLANPSMPDYTHAFKELFDNIGLSKFSIYGSATGAQIGIRYGLEYPEDAEHLYLDNCAHFTSEERSQIKAHYFPDLTPKLDGSHLTQTWGIVTNLFKFFPWCFQDDTHKLTTPMPPLAVLHAITMDYLTTGADYDLAYKAAFDHEKFEHINSLNVPASIFRWDL